MLREPAAKSCHDHSRGLMEVPSAAVIAQTRPELEDVFQRSAGEAGDVWEGPKEAPVVGNDRRHLRLLQHDL
jgi:hypothetical protein